MQSAGLWATATLLWPSLPLVTGQASTETTFDSALASCSFHVCGPSRPARPHDRSLISLSFSAATRSTLMSIMCGVSHSS